MSNPLRSNQCQDTANRTWTIDITVATLRRVKQLANFSFDELIATPTGKKKDHEAIVAPLRAFLDDTGRFLEVLWAILKPDAEKASPCITQDDFDGAFRGQAIDDAQSAFLVGLHDFFPNAPKRMIVKGLIEERKNLAIANRTAQKRMEKEIAEMSPEKVEAMVNKEIDSALSLKSASEPPASSESTPTLTA